jgi:nitrogen fixation protein FixH
MNPQTPSPSRETSPSPRAARPGPPETGPVPDHRMPPARSPWPLGITLALLVFASGLAALIAFAVTSNSDLVVQDYYEQDLLYQEQIDRRARTEPLAERLRVSHDPALDKILIQLPSEHATLDTAGEVHLYRPSAADLDRRWPLELNAAGMQILDAQDLAPGLWQVKIQWTTRGQEYYVDRRVVIEADNP